MSEVRVLPPAKASKVAAMGMNFASHIASASDAPPPVFLKLPTSLIGEKAKHISDADTPDVIFGVTAGNDLTERSWQGRDCNGCEPRPRTASDPWCPLSFRGWTAMTFS